MVAKAAVLAALLAVTAACTQQPGNRQVAVSSRPVVGPIRSADLDLYVPQPVTPNTRPTPLNVHLDDPNATPTQILQEQPALPQKVPAGGSPQIQAAGAPAITATSTPREAGALKRVVPKPWTPPVTVAPVAAIPVSGIWACIIRHESGGNPKAVNPRSGASGLVQFEPATWHAMGMSGEAADYPASVQMAVAYRLQAKAGWSPWIGDGCTPLG